MPHKHPILKEPLIRSLSFNEAMEIVFRGGAVVGEHFQEGYYLGLTSGKEGVQIKSNNGTSSPLLLNQQVFKQRYRAVCESI